MAINWGDFGLGAATGGLAVVGKKLFGGKKAKPIDITRQIDLTKALTEKNKGLNTGLFNELQPLTQDYENRAAESRLNLRHAFDTGKRDYLSATEGLTNKAKEAQRGNLYSGTFAGLPDALRAVREASASGSGIDSGAYQQSVQNIGIDTARRIAEGERDIELSGLQNLQSAQEQAFNAFNQLSAKLSDLEMQALTKAVDTRREDVVRRVTTEMGLNEAETQSIIDLMNFQASGQLAQQTASDANRTALLTALIGGGARIAGEAIGA